MKRVKKVLKRYSAFVVVAILYSILAISGIGCPIRAITGIPCAGCGMTRAYLSLLHMDLEAAFYYHPLFWVVPIALVIYFVKKGPLANKKVKIVVFSIMIVVVVIVYILRLLVWKDSAIYIRRN